jgi:hypothetical protein
MERADASTATGRRLNIPQLVFRDAGAMPPRAELFNTADGAPTSGPIVLHFGVDLHPDLLNLEDDLDASLKDDHPIALIDLETGRRIMFLAEMDQNRRLERHQGRHSLIIRPQEPMRFGKKHALIIRGPVRDADGNTLAPPRGFAALRDKERTDHEALEAAREDFEALFTRLGELGFERDSLFIVNDFQVASRDYVLGPVLSMRAEAFRMVEAGELSYTIEEVRTPENDPNVEKIVLGNFQVPTYLREDNTFEYDADHLPVRRQEHRSFPFTMLIPKAALDGEPLPLTILGHGIFGEGRDYLVGGNGRVTQPLAQQARSVVVATDWIGLSGGDINLIIQQVVPDLNRLTLVTDRLQQSLINNLTLIELVLKDIQHDAQVKVGDHDLLRTDEVFYYGVSLGGIQGSSLVSLSRHITRAILAVPGSSWSNMLARSIVYTPIKTFIDIRYPDPLLQQSFISMLQLHFDHSDPVNVGQLMKRDPLPDAPAKRVVVLQEAIADCQVPNQVTRVLARALGAKLLEPVIEPVPGLDTIAGPTDEVVLAQFLLPAANDYRPPAENVIPEMDNNVHSDLIFEQSVQAQIIGLVVDSLISMFCDGVCDPD